mgnify:CR=1 FL=1
MSADDGYAHFVQRTAAIAMAQGEYIKLHQKRHGKRLDHDERARKKEALRLKLQQGPKK